MVMIGQADAVEAYFFSFVYEFGQGNRTAGRGRRGVYMKVDDHPLSGLDQFSRPPDRLLQP